MKGTTMSAVIYGNRFRGRGEPAWHGLGEIFNDDPSCVDAFVLARLNYNVIKRALVATMPDGSELPIDNEYAVVREATDDEPAMVLSVVGNTYKPIQNMKIAEIVDASGLLDKYQIETVGALGNGETIFTALSERGGSFEIAGSEVRSFWTIYNGHDGHRALGLMYTPVKVVCSNTLMMGIDSATISAKMSHGTATEADLSFWLSLAPQLQVAQQRTKEIMGQLVEFHVTDADVSTILKAAYPGPKVNAKGRISDMTKMDLTDFQKGVVDRALSANDAAALRQFQKATLARDTFVAYADTTEEKGQAGTAWGVYEAVCDVEDHREASKKSEDVFGSAIFGPRARSKSDAFRAAMQVAGIS